MYKHTYFALFVGALLFPVGFFMTEQEAEDWRESYYPQAPHYEIRRYELLWATTHTDEHLRPNIFMGTEELLPH
ncbi:MAG TPA: hypothetical protein VHO06_22775 [Polyangia bacterium]|nr:hypothetical protein [Polyangia bacterium]